MARYREKDETDLRWNKIRRRITRELDIQISEWREEALNVLLADAWRRFVEAMNDGEVLQIEADFHTFVSQAMEDAGIGGDLKLAIGSGKTAKAPSS